MDAWAIWLIVAISLMVAEFIVPGGIVIFLGLSAMIVSGLVYLEWIISLTHALITWFIVSIIFMFFVRSLFMKYFEGDSLVQEVDEDIQLIGKEVEVIEDVSPDIQGRIRMRDTTWVATSEEIINQGELAIVKSIDGSILIIKSK